MSDGDSVEYSRGSGGREMTRAFECLDGFRTLAACGRFKGWFLDQFGVLHDGKKPYPGAILTSLGRSCIHMTWSDRGAISLDGLGLQVVNRVDEADFILAHGTEALGLPSGDSLPMTMEELEQILELCNRRKIPMVVANPDFVTVEARALRVMPAMAMAGLEACDCIAVGDSLHHDVRGANNAGVESAFITGGIHAAELGLHDLGESADPEAVQALASKYDAQPSYVLPTFSWMETSIFEAGGLLEKGEDGGHSATKVVGIEGYDNIDVVVQRRVLMELWNVRALRKSSTTTGVAGLHLMKLTEIKEAVIHEGWSEGAGLEGSSSG
ncbi:hypothetical protein AXF42_Ash001379 [Apostasia shenzhenica]|uniref:Uncharacterized protein n=1 Tax=Apostasia shenzhenica TaxID=1088818 RepID=A0A2I0AUR3_9ASPA|nr:hypothetical protein AXF42_Ash001379 [Apostasia shenzhenica]